jgi:ATP-binding cassette subfamily F protein uup
MHYLSAENLGKSYGITPLFQDISFHLSEGDKVGLIARNGVGKSTLLRIIAGKETADSGKLWIHKDVKPVLFEQEPLFDENKTIAENIFEHDHPVLNAIRDYETVSEANDTETLMHAIQRMDELGAWDFDARVKQILGKLNIHHLDQRVASLSGGQRKRVALARTLIDVGFGQSHSLLLLDEPTNHLDVEMIEWLENYLNQERVTLLMVTHDRYFLDAVCDEIWEMERSNLYGYEGNYETYLEKKAARIDNELANIDKAKNLYRNELEWMRKQPRARTTKAKSRIDSFYEVEHQAKRRVVDEQLQLHVKMTRLGGKVAEMKKVYKSFGKISILKGFDYTFSKGERIGVVGKNGVGKSTFLHLLQGLEPADSGKINIGDTVVFGNYDQQGLTWKEDMRVIEYVKTFAETFPLASGGVLTASKFLELFLFPAEKQYTYLSMLSGGEKRRLQLLTILFSNPNFLILDEPTNDLDLPTLGVLEKFMSEYQGCVMIVSHDRYFMDKLVDHLFVFEGDGVVRGFPGNYSQYRIDLWQREKTKAEVEVKAKAEDKEKAKVEVEQKAEKRRKLSFKEQRELEQLDKDIPALEAERQELTVRMQEPTTDYAALQQISARIEAIGTLLEEKEMRWLELSDMG